MVGLNCEDASGIWVPGSLAGREGTVVLDPTSSLPTLLPREPWWVRSGPGLAWKAGGGGLAIQGFPSPCRLCLSVVCMVLSLSHSV